MRKVLLASALALSMIAAPVLAQDTPAPVGAAEAVATAQAAIARSKSALQCRFAFTMKEKAANQTLWASFDLERSQTASYDPRRERGERWEVKGASRPRVEQRRQMNWGTRSDPRTDVLTIPLEGDIEITELKLTEERPDAWVFSFKPFATGTVNPQGRGWLNQLTGELVVSKSGQIVSRTLIQQGVFEAGLGRARDSRFTRFYSAGRNGEALLASTKQELTMSARGRGVDSVGEQVYSGVEPICDPAEVKRIADYESSESWREKGDMDPRTGSRIRR
jgi:hypothetical protein